MYVGIDLEQFVRDPQSSGIQRVLQNLSRYWPHDVDARFVVPVERGFALLTAPEAAELIDQAFLSNHSEDIRARVSTHLEHLASSTPTFSQSQLLSIFHAWLLPEVSYLPSVLDRFEIFQQSVTTSMIGYDALPMTEPGNYRFTPGSSANVSRYFHLLTQADVVICISEYSRDALLSRLRRDRQKKTLVSHPGGDHEPAQAPRSTRPQGATKFVKLGTLESRKKPLELLSAFRAAAALGVNAEFTFIGRPSASDLETNRIIAAAVAEGIGVRWIPDASDEAVRREVRDADYFVSIGVEGYGIPVLEAIRSGTPVLFHGIQPAAELMDQHGAVHLDSDAPENLIQMFLRFSNSDVWQSTHEQVDPEAVPRWATFAADVAHATSHPRAV